MPNRTICCVLDEMRKAYETRNFSYLLGLIEEAQSMANKMEARIYDIHDYESVRDAYKDMKQKRDEIQDELLALEIKKRELDELISIERLNPCKQK